MKYRIVYILLVLIIYPNVMVLSQNVECGGTKYGRITFGNKSRKLSRKARHALDSLAIIMKQDTTCEIFIMSHGADFCEPCDLIGWDRQLVVYNYLKSKGVNNITPGNNILDGNKNYLEFYLFDKYKEALPHPNLRRSKKG